MSNDRERVTPPAVMGVAFWVEPRFLQGLFSRMFTEPPYVMARCDGDDGTSSRH